MTLLFGHLDRYVARYAWSAYAGGLAALLLLSILLDQLFNVWGYIGSALEKGLSGVDVALLLLEYYVLLTPLLFVTISPFVSVIAGMFAVSGLMGSNQIAPMLFTGRSISRVMLPVFGMGAISALLTAACWEFLIPRLSGPLREARQLIQGGDVDASIKGVVLKFGGDGARRTLFCSKLDPERLRIEGVYVLDYARGPDDVVVVSAEAGTWNAELAIWQLENAERHDGDLVVPLRTLELEGMTPQRMIAATKEQRETMELSYSDLLSLQRLRPGRPDFVIAFHTHITYPLANLVLLLLALPFAVDFERRSRVERVLFAVLVCGVYLVVDLICQNLGRSHLHPMLAAWMPTILFGSIGVSLFSGVRT